MVRFSRMVGLMSNGYMAVPMWIPHGVVATGFGLMALIAALRLVEIVTGHAPDGGASGTGA